MTRILFILLCLFETSSLALAQYFPAKLYKDIEGLPSNVITDIDQAPNKEIWFATDNGIVIYDGLLNSILRK